MKNKNQNIKERIYFYTFILILIILSFIFLRQKPEQVVIITEKLEPKIDLNQYKLATFSDSFSSDAWIDLDETTLILNQEQRSFVFPELKQDLTGSLSDDLESQQQPRQIVSKKFNFSVKEIKAVRIDKSKNTKVNSQITYFVSNDKGLNWIKADIGQIIYFKQAGNDLCWKTIISFLSEDKIEVKNSSQINSINLTYWYER